MTIQEQRSGVFDRILALPEGDFESTALEVFRYQAAFNPLYAEYVSLLGRNPAKVQSLEEIPFLPIQFFKSHPVKTSSWEAQKTFSSSGTTGTATSFHAVRDLEWYQHNAVEAFESVYGPLSEYCLLALLPAYLERTGSSLVFMVEHFIRQTGHPRSGFFLYNTTELIRVLEEVLEGRQKVLLWGVSFALLDLAEQHPLDLGAAIVMETGGMKGRRKEWIRSELHAAFMEAFGIQTVHSEFGMTELLSQAYSKGGGIFSPSSRMKVLVRDLTDPFRYVDPGRTGALNIIDLANLDTCSFIETQDLGRAQSNGAFEVLGRTDHSDVRGCNLLLEENH